jgi:hypothetical protein
MCSGKRADARPNWKEARGRSTTGAATQLGKRRNSKWRSVLLRDAYWAIFVAVIVVGGAKLLARFLAV